MSIVTVAKLVDVKVSGACNCPSGGSSAPRQSAPTRSPARGRGDSSSLGPFESYAK